MCADGFRIDVHTWFVFSHLSRTSFLTFTQAPIAYPIAKLLDYVLGADHPQLYKKAELKSFLQFHSIGEEPLRNDELAILNGVLELNAKNVEAIMTPLRVCGVCAVMINWVWTHRCIGRCDTELG